MRFLSLALMILAASVAGCGSDEGGESGGDLDPASLVLRLSDLPDGYRVGDDSGCGTLGIEGASEAQTELFFAYQPQTCSMQYERLFPADKESLDPPLVESMAFVFPSDSGAESGFEIVDELIAYSVGLQRHSIRESDADGVTLGDQARLISTDDALVEGEAGQPGAALAWRSGSVVSAVFVGGLQRNAGIEAAESLAELLQERIESPVPLETKDQDDREVALDNPELGIDIYWLGRRFDPPDDLPELTLYRGYGPIERGGSPGNIAEVQYELTDQQVGVSIALWRPNAWARFGRTRAGERLWPQPCSNKKLDLPSGQGGGHIGRVSEGGCSNREPARFVANTRIDDVVVVVNMPVCFNCFRMPHGDAAPYNSREGMTAILRGLRLREPTE